MNLIWLRVLLLLFKVSFFRILYEYVSKLLFRFKNLYGKNLEVSLVDTNRVSIFSSYLNIEYNHGWHFLEQTRKTHFYTQIQRAGNEAWNSKISNVIDVVLVFSLLTFNIFHTFFWCFYYCLWTSIC